MRILIIRSPYRYNIQPLDLYSTIFAFFCQTLLLSSIVFCWLEQIARQSPSRQVDKLTSCPCLLSWETSATQPLIDCFRRNSELLVILNCSDLQHDGQERYCNFRNDYHQIIINQIESSKTRIYDSKAVSCPYFETLQNSDAYSQSGFLATSFLLLWPLFPFLPLKLSVFDLLSPISTIQLLWFCLHVTGHQPEMVGQENERS